jgi:hypothetical protein
MTSILSNPLHGLGVQVGLVAYNAVVDVAFEFLTFALKLGLLHYWLLKSVALALFVPAVPTRLFFHRV